MIVKPAQETPLTMLLLAKLMAEAGLPSGVLSVLATNKPREVTTALIDDGRLRKLTFTGSTGVGKALVKQSADKLLRTSMELVQLCLPFTIKWVAFLPTYTDKWSHLRMVAKKSYVVCMRLVNALAYQYMAQTA
jgi:hypothetical protein